MASKVRLSPEVLRDLAVVACRTTVLGCTEQMLIGVAVCVLGKLLKQRSGTITDVRRAFRCCSGKFSRHHGCLPSPINVLACDPHLLNA